MKRVRIYQQIISDENLRLAIQEVNRGHRRNGDHSLNKKVMEIEAHIDEYVVKLRKFIEDLVTGDEHMHKPLQRRKWDRNADSGKGKWRDINEPLFVAGPVCPPCGGAAHDSTYQAEHGQVLHRKRAGARQLLWRKGFEEMDEE